MGLAALWHVGFSWMRDCTHVSCTGRWILYHWATREALQVSLDWIMWAYWYWWHSPRAIGKTLWLPRKDIQTIVLMTEWQDSHSQIFFELPFSFWGACGHAACGILVLWWGIEFTPPTEEVQNLNHWTAMEVSPFFLFLFFFYVLHWSMEFTDLWLWAVLGAPTYLTPFTQSLQMFVFVQMDRFQWSW